eukprot:COSAG01_NODE_66243_length_270_cov_4.163743_1_plen_43_part_10
MAGCVGVDVASVQWSAFPYWVAAAVEASGGGSRVASITALWPA